jgi:HlyD family secretion protein
VAATGTLNAVTTVQVGTQVSGRIQELLADFNSSVTRDQVIAVIDPANFRTRVAQAEADLEVGRAGVAIQEANVERVRTDLDNASAELASARAQTEIAVVALADAKRDLNRKQALFRKQVISANQMDAAQLAFDQAAAQLSSLRAREQAAVATVAAGRAAVKMAHAQVTHAMAQVSQKEAALADARVDLDYTIIRSPVDGVVIERSVDVGQTVAASLQTPRLFLIAQDLRSMQVEADVDEADIGRIEVGQKATFSVDAFPGREFGGEVLQVRKAPHSVQNVVTYTVIVSAANDDLRLMPGMTADIQILINERRNVLKVPNAALRFQPPAAGSLKSPAGGIDATGAARERLQKTARFLKLTDQQEKELREAFSDIRRQIDLLRRQGGQEDRIRELLERARDNNRRRLEAILTPSQRETYERFLKAREEGAFSSGRVWIIGGDGKPVAVDVDLGISDNDVTEIVGGEIEAGQAVITGLVAKIQPDR